MMWILSVALDLKRGILKACGERSAPLITPAMILEDAKRLVGLDVVESAVPSPEDLDLAMDELSRLYHD